MPNPFEMPAPGALTGGGRSAVPASHLRASAAAGGGRGRRARPWRSATSSGLVERGGRVVGAVVDGSIVTADLVIDASGRLSRLAAPPELDGDVGMAYVVADLPPPRRRAAGADDRPVRLERHAPWLRHLRLPPRARPHLRRHHPADRRPPSSACLRHRRCLRRRCTDDPRPGRVDRPFRRHTHQRRPDRRWDAQPLPAAGRPPRTRRDRRRGGHHRTHRRSGRCHGQHADRGTARAARRRG